MLAVFDKKFRQQKVIENHLEEIWEANFVLRFSIEERAVSISDSRMMPWFSSDGLGFYLGLPTFFLIFPTLACYCLFIFITKFITTIILILHSIYTHLFSHYIADKAMTLLLSVWDWLEGELRTKNKKSAASFSHIKQIFVTMDLKRPLTINIHHSPTHIKGNHLINSLQSIVGASTPIRTRVVKPSMPTTPTGLPKDNSPPQVKSPKALSNKENEGTFTRAASRPKFSQQGNIAYSPILALNRKNSQAHERIEERKMTPTQHRRQESMKEIRLQEEEYQSAMMEDRALKQSRKLNACFGSIFANRSKTPTRIGLTEWNSGNLGMSNSRSVLRSSGSTQSLLGGFNKMHESRRTPFKLRESRSFQDLFSQGTPQDSVRQILCINSAQHEKKARAKYKVVGECESIGANEEQDLLIYCSKCAINLVKKGFKVEDLSPHDIQRLKSSSRQDNSEYYHYAQQTCDKLKSRHSQLCLQKQKLQVFQQKEIEEVDWFYNSLIEIIEERRSIDRQAILYRRDQEKSNGEILDKNLSEAIGRIESLLDSRLIGEKYLPQIQDFEGLLTQKAYQNRNQVFPNPCILSNPQEQYHYFCDVFENQIRLHLDSTQQQPKAFPSNSQQNSQPALRFSFEATLKKTRDMGVMRAAMNPLQEASEQLESDSEDISSNDQNDDGRKAFRALFPENNQNYHRPGTTLHSPTFKQF